MVRTVLTLTGDAGNKLTADHKPATAPWTHAAARQEFLTVQVAAALKAEKLILMTDVPGVMRNKDDVSTKFTELDIRDTRQLVAEGVIAGGMIPKVKSDFREVNGGLRAGLLQTADCRQHIPAPVQV